VQLAILKLPQQSATSPVVVVAVVSGVTGAVAAVIPTLVLGVVNIPAWVLKTSSGDGDVVVAFKE
jgi:hypothetical protein